MYLFLIFFLENIYFFTSIIYVFIVTILDAGFYPRQNLIPGRDSTLGLHHPSDILARPLTDQVR